MGGDSPGARNLSPSLLRGRCLVTTYSTVQYSTVQHSTAQYSTVQYLSAQGPVPGDQRSGGPERVAEGGAEHDPAGAVLL